MQQIAEWLEKLGMSEYAQRFAENGIDFGVLPDLTDQDLKDIGVLLGHRRKMLRGITELKGASAEGRASGCRIHYTARGRRASSSHGDVF
jgi:hypothetical protein